MVIYLTDDLINDRKSVKDFYQFLFIIMLAYKEGKHFISISPRNVKSLIDDDELKKRPELYQILISYQTHCKSYNLENFEKYFNIIIKLIHNGNEYSYSTTEKKIEYRCIKYNKFLDSVTIQKTILLGENPSDAETYKIFSDYYQKQQKLNYRSLYEARGGGGNTVVKEYEPIYNSEERFCLCILDSDKRTPTKTKYGNTAQPIVDYHTKASKRNYKSTYYILDVLELENLLPKDFFISCYSSDVNKREIFMYIEKLLKVDDRIRVYYDFKKGIPCGELDKNNKLKCKEHIKTYFCEAVQNANLTLTNHKYINSYGDKILDDFIKENIDDIVIYVDNDNFVKPFWDDLSKLIASHILAPNKQRAI